MSWKLHVQQQKEIAYKVTNDYDLSLFNFLNISLYSSY